MQSDSPGIDPNETIPPVSPQAHTSLTEQAQQAQLMEEQQRLAVFAYHQAQRLDLTHFKRYLPSVC